MPNWDDVFSVREGIVTRESGDELVVVIPDRAKYVVLNPTGARVLALADGHRTLQDIAVAIADEFGEAVETVQPDILNFARSLVERDVLVPPGG